MRQPRQQRRGHPRVGIPPKSLSPAIEGADQFRRRRRLGQPGERALKCGAGLARAAASPRVIVIGPAPARLISLPLALLQPHLRRADHRQTLLAPRNLRRKIQLRFVHIRW